MSDLNKALAALENFKTDITSNLSLKIDEMKNEIKNQFNVFTASVLKKIDGQDESIRKLEAENKVMKEKLDSVIEINKHQEAKLSKIENRLIENEAHQRRNNLIFHNIEEETDEDVERKVCKVFIDDLHLNAERVNRFTFRDIHRLGRFKKSEGDTRAHPRAIIVAFLDQRDRNLVYSRGKQLSGSKISMRVDLPFEYSKERESLLTVRKSIKNINSKKVAILTYRSYKPVLLVKVNGSIIKYDQNQEMDQLECE